MQSCICVNVCHHVAWHEQIFVASQMCFPTAPHSLLYIYIYSTHRFFYILSLFPYILSVEHWAITAAACTHSAQFAATIFQVKSFPSRLGNFNVIHMYFCAAPQTPGHRHHRDWMACGCSQCCRYAVCRSSRLNARVIKKKFTYKLSGIFVIKFYWVNANRGYSRTMHGWRHEEQQYVCS